MADCNARYVRSYSEHGTDHLVPRNEWPRPVKVAVDDMKICAADPAGTNLNQEIMAGGRAKGALRGLK